MRLATMYFLAMTMAAQAQTQPTPAAPVSVAGSNMPANFYPRSPCIKPQKVKTDGPPRSAQPSAPMANVAVEQFNTQAVAFNICIKLYVDNARLDTQRILDAANGATQGSAAAIPAGGGNLLAGFYPPSPCIQPVPPDSDAAPDPKAARSRGSVRPQHGPRMDEYNRQVHVFNTQAAAFNACAKTYMDNAKRDIELVQGIVRTAVADANAPLADPKGDFMTDRRR